MINDVYMEILFEIECKDKLLQEIITQCIADVILDYGDGVEFIDGNVNID